jgi:hypothetical protein
VIVDGVQSRRVRDDASTGGAPGEARAGPVVFLWSQASSESPGDRVRQSVMIKRLAFVFPVT